MHLSCSTSRRQLLSELTRHRHQTPSIHHSICPFIKFPLGYNPAATMSVLSPGRPAVRELTIKKSRSGRSEVKYIITCADAERSKERYAPAFWSGPYLPAVIPLAWRPSSMAFTHTLGSRSCCTSIFVRWFVTATNCDDHQLSAQAHKPKLVHLPALLVVHAC